MRNFICHKIWGVTPRANEGVIQKLAKISQKVSFLAEVLVIFKISLKTLTYVMRYFVWYLWWNFFTNRTSFVGVILEKPPRSSQKSNSLFWKFIFKVFRNLKIFRAPPIVASKTLDKIMYYSSGAKTKFKKRKQQVKIFVHYNHLRRSKWINHTETNQCLI